MSKGATVAIAVGGVAAAAAALFWVLSQRKAGVAAAANPQVGAAAAPPAPTTSDPTGGRSWVDIGIGLASDLITKYGGRAVAGSGQLADLGVDKYTADLAQLSQKAFG